MTPTRTSRASRWAAYRRRLLVLVSAILGFIWFRRAYLLLRDGGAAYWALSLLYCFIAASAWVVMAGFLRSRRPAEEAVEPVKRPDGASASAGTGAGAKAGD